MFETISEPIWDPKNDRGDSERYVQNAALNEEDIEKLNLQLFHGSKTAMEKYLRVAGLCSSCVESLIDKMFHKWDCNLECHPKSQTKVGTRPSSTDIQNLC